MQELQQWVECITFDGVSPMADWRKKNGHDQPWKLRYLGIGNENWGCGGNMTAPVITAHNTFDEPEAVKPADFNAFKSTDGGFTATLPRARSWCWKSGSELRKQRRSRSPGESSHRLHSAAKPHRA